MCYWDIFELQTPTLMHSTSNNLELWACNVENLKLKHMWHSFSIESPKIKFGATLVVYINQKCNWVIRSSKEIYVNNLLNSLNLNSNFIKRAES